MGTKLKIRLNEQKKLKELLTFLPKVVRMGKTTYTSEVVVSLCDWRELMSKLNGEMEV